jgi:hypothetical protein
MTKQEADNALAAVIFGDDQPDQCHSCGEYQKPGELWERETVDLDPGDAENGPDPDIQEVSTCALCLGKRAILDVLDVDMIAQVYSGRPGCGCGCRGKYSEDKSTKSRILNAVRFAPLGEIRMDVNGFGDDARILIAWENETRYRWIYVR